MNRIAIAILLVAACASRRAPASFAIPPATKQLVTAIVDDWTATRATVRVWVREGSTWKPAGDPWQAVIGNTGAAWGVGLHGAGAPGRAGPIKREGDGKSPAGVFTLRGAYGYAHDAPAGARVSYVALDERYECVDDPASPNYARIVDHDRVKPDWHSSEHMRRTDELYTWVVDVGHNPDARPGAGSCIFLHVWSGPDSSTVGCTAMAEPQLAHLISALDPAAGPLYVLLPRADYSALAVPWGLPAQ